MKARLAHLPADVWGLTQVARAALAGGANFAPVPVPPRLAEVARPDERLGEGERAALVRPLRAGLTHALGDPPARVETSLRALEREGTHCVVTGQQPGLLTSPLYSFYKALQACRTATDLSRTWGAPVVPVFWNHADDHDVAEVHHAWQLNRNLDLQKVALPGLASGRTPVGELVLSAEQHRLPAVKAQLAQMFEEHGHTERALELCFPREGETLARALTRAFTELLGPHGLVVLEPDWVRPQLSSELGRIVSGGQVVDALRAGERELEALGLAAAIPVDADEAAGRPAAALVYHHDAEQGRVALRVGGEGYRYDDEPGSRTAAELGAEIVDAPAEWSAGALLRPLVQDAVLPCCAYVGGWGELAYHAQLGPLRDAVGVPRTAFLPRVSCTLVDDETRHALSRCETDVEAVLRARGEFAPTDDDPGPRVIEDLRSAAEEAAQLVLRHRAALSELEPALAIGLKKAADQIRGAVGKVADKADRVHRNSAGKGERQVRRVNHVLAPRGLPQERVLGLFQFLARHGDDLVDALWGELPPLAAEHLVIHLEDEAP